MQINISTLPYKKRVILYPLFQDGDKQDISNYGLISLFACMSKALEKLVFDKIYRRQHGYTKNMSTMTQTALYLSDMYDNFFEH